MRSGLFFLPFFSSGSCLHRRDELVLLVWGLILAGAGQEGPKLWLRAGQCWHRAQLGSAECCPLPNAAGGRHFTFPGLETAAAHRSGGRSSHPSLPRAWTPQLRLWGPAAHLPSGSCPWLSAQPQRKVLYSTPPKDCCEKKHSPANQIFSPWSSARLRSEVSTKEGGRGGQCLVKPAGWMIQCLLPACSAAQILLSCPNPAPWSLQGACQRALPASGNAAVPPSQPYKLRQKPRLCLAQDDPSCPSGSSRDKLCSWPLISGHSGLCPSWLHPLGWLHSLECIYQDECWGHHLPQAGHWEQLGWPWALSISKFIQLQNWNSRKLNLWPKVLPKSKVGSLCL